MRKPLLLPGLVVIVSSFCMLRAQAPAENHSVWDGVYTEEQAKRGETVYRKECAACHGARRQGSEKAPPLNRGDIREAPPGALFWVLRNGSLHRGMPSFAHLPELERWQIVTLLQEVPEPKAEPHHRP